MRDFIIKQWRYEPTKDYGGPKLDMEDLEIERFQLSEDRKKIYISLPSIKENRVVYFRIVNSFESDLGHSLWTTEAWYTLNQIPQDKPVSRSDYNLSYNLLTPIEKSEG